MQASRGRRRGNVFSTRITDEERADVEARMVGAGGPAALGPWLVWWARRGPGPGNTAAAALPAPAGVVPAQAGHYPAGGALPGRGRIVLDLCGGSGAWSAPYVRAGYDVRLVTLPGGDVRDYQPPPGVWGVLAAPPCTEFSIAKTTGERDFAAGLETVVACLRIIATASPEWWALENPGSGLLRRWMGTPRDVWQPADFGDHWTKLTAVWGDFTIPERAHVRPLSGMPGANAAERAVTPPGFAEAFFRANP